MKTVLHLERKFTSNTETFIINQVNLIAKYNVIVVTIRSLNNFECNKKIITPNKRSAISNTAKVLSKSTCESLFNQLKDYKIDLIHVHYLVDALYFKKLVEKFNVPKIVSSYGYDVTSFPNIFFGFGRLLLKTVFRHYDYFFAMSQDMKTDLVKLGCKNEKIMVHYYGTETSKFNNTSRDYKRGNKIKILSVGTLEEKKAQLLVIEALYLLEKKHPNVNYEYHIIGGGPDENKIMEKCIKYNMTNKVFIHGYIHHHSKELKKFYDDCNIFILPSITTKSGEKEGIPGTIVEAMSNGLPVISTYHAGIPSIIENVVHGLLVKERDIQALEEAIYSLISNIELCRKIGQNAQTRAINELDLKAKTIELENIYKNIIDNDQKNL